ncbi:hypothetical protein NCC78_31525 [Micromonospora phytophila]|uniref:hypothetical protein n=1 Tax=Micromonospora phytophila TaxID=709888 RepID=UPI00202E5550|nr:hypothetical protein [Micromonospora phytophila]MCM0679165.1 hypothetical protein [Micromonospora phytophila]
MAVIWPFSASDLKSGLPPRGPVDRRVLLRKWLFGLGAVTLVIAAGFLGAQLGRIAAPTVVRWQVDMVDSTNQAPPLPHLPQSPFAR